MSSLSWNCRGLGNPRTVQVLVDLVKVHKPCFIFLYETLSWRARLDSTRVRLGYKGLFSVDCVGHSGGLVLM